MTKDRYGRIIGRVHLGGVDVNADMVSTAWRGCIASTPKIKACTRSKMKHERRGEGYGLIVIRCRLGSGEGRKDHL